MLTKGTLLAAREEVNRKFSVGSRLLPSPHGHNRRCRHLNCNNYLLVVDNTYNRPASRSHSVDNSLAEKVDHYRDSNSTGSAYSGRSYSSLSSVEKENVWKLSVSSDTRCRYGRLLSPSPKRTSRNCELAADICLHSLDFVQEVGYYLDPSHRPEDSSEPRVPQAPCLQMMNLGRRSRSSQPPSSLPLLPRERVKKRSVFSQSNFCLVDQICEANEPTSPRSEHEFNLIVPESHRKGISGSKTKASNCKISWVKAWLCNIVGLVAFKVSHTKCTSSIHTQLYFAMAIDYYPSFKTGLGLKSRAMGSPSWYQLRISGFSIKLNWTRANR